MRQGAIFGVILIILSIFGATYVYTSENDDSKFKTLSLVVEGEEIYSSPLDTYTNKIIWYVKEESGDKLVLENQEILDYYELSNDLADLTDPDLIDFEKIEKKSGNNIHFNMLLVSEAEVSVYDANCENKTCIKEGKISKNNQQIACIPHKFIAKISGSDTEKGYTDA